ncbi:unnamed protein product [Parnassius apollo]|uniref:(apollo) hypothetical protein n=1 Tax=Parnassius apollo TaxID=110799 RepID=A0A8S3WCH8_PARAO|nr:unnamed protein product [Parnassius apollo]
MSDIDEEVIIAPWVGPMCCKNVLTIVVLSTNIEIIDRISDSLTEMHSKGAFKWKLIILRSFHLEELVRQSDLTGKVAIDFVILAMDTSRIFCIEWSKKMLGQVHPDLRIRRVILVNASGLPLNAMAVNACDILAFTTEQKLDMLSANVFQQREVMSLARRIIKYMEVSLGIKTGIPNLNL